MTKYISILILIFLNFCNFANAEDPFSRSFTTPILSSAGDPLGFESMENVDEGVHPMIRYPIERYIVKGVVISNKGSIAIISAPGSSVSEILFIGDPLGNDMHTIHLINNDFILASNNSGEDVSIYVSNPMVMETLN